MTKKSRTIFEHWQFRNVDNKGRVIIPKNLRKKLGDKLIIRAYLDQDLFLYNSEDDEKIKSLFSFSLQDHYEKLEVDEHGRICIPKIFRTYALIDASEYSMKMVVIEENYYGDTLLLRIFSLKRMGETSLESREKVEKFGIKYADRSRRFLEQIMPDIAMEFVVKDTLELLKQFDYLVTGSEIQEYIKKYFKIVEQIKKNEEYEIINKKDRSLSFAEKLEKYVTLAELYEFFGDYEKAIAARKKLISIDPDNSNNFINLGNVLFLQGKYKEAIKNFLIALEKNEFSIITRYNLMMAYAKIKEYEKAISIHKKIFLDNPQVMILFTNYENLAPTIGLNYASSFFKVSIFLKPGLYGLLGKSYPISGSSLANSTGRKFYGDWISRNALIKAYNLMKKNKKHKSSAHNDAGNFFYENGLFDYALDSFKQAILAEPENSDFQTHFAITLAVKKQYDEALKHLNEAIRIKKNYRGTIFFLGLVYEMKGLHDKAKNEYKVAINTPDKKDF